jgi:hypothetical protein
MRVVAPQRPVVGERPGEWGRTFAAREAATAERASGTARAELIEHILIFGERHLQTVLARYSTHYNGRRHIERCDFSRHDPIVPPRTKRADQRRKPIRKTTPPARILLLDRLCLVRAMVATGLFGHLISAG